MKLLTLLFGNSLWMAARRLDKVIDSGEFYLIREEMTKNITGRNHDFIVIIYGIRRMDSGYGDTLSEALNAAIKQYRLP